MTLIGCNNRALNHRLRGLDIRSNTHFQIRIYAHAYRELAEGHQPADIHAGFEREGFSGAVGGF
jgi:hypothetical protein